LQAAADLGIELEASWMIGDMVSDTLAGRNAGCFRTVLVKTGLFDPTVETHPSVDYVLNTISDLPTLMLT
jgi:D-glycero-D-manno-heptose 1,7-bisphosphate phosphatase